MPVSKKRKSPKKPGRLQSKKFLLPMPREDADALCLQSRLALQAARGQRAARQETIVLAQTALLTSFLTESGDGLLDLPFARRVEEAVLAMLDAGEKRATGGTSATRSSSRSPPLSTNTTDSCEKYASAQSWLRTNGWTEWWPRSACRVRFSSVRAVTCRAAAGNGSRARPYPQVH